MSTKRYRVVLVLALQMMLYELDVVYGFFQLERILFPDRGRHLVQRVVDGRHGRVHQVVGRARGRCPVAPVAPGSAGGGHDPAQRVGGRIATGRRRPDWRWWHVQRRANAGRVQPVRGEIELFKFNCTQHRCAREPVTNP